MSYVTVSSWQLSCTPGHQGGNRGWIGCQALIVDSLDGPLRRVPMPLSDGVRIDR